MAIDNNTSQLKIVEFVGVDAGIPRLTNVTVALEFVKIEKEPNLIGGDVEILEHINILASAVIMSFFIVASL